MMTGEEISRREIRIAEGLEHRGECERTFPTGVKCDNYGRLLKCQTCGLKVCFWCKDRHTCKAPEVQNAAS